MKKLATVAMLCACALALSACGESGDLLCAPERAEPLSYTARQEAAKECGELCAAEGNFSAAFSAALYGERSGKGNFVAAPVSLYSALALAAECAAGGTREEILSALGVSYEVLRTQYAPFFRSLTAEYGEEKVTARLALGNSVWTGGAQPKEERLRALADGYYSYSYAADFAGDNAGANRAVRRFVKEQTYGLIDRDFSLPQNTAFALINTLYLKDAWLWNGDLTETAQTYSFTQKNGDVKETKLLQGKYLQGRAYEGGNFRSFYTQTIRGYKLKFILPREGYTAEQAFTAENIALVNSVSDYGEYDEESNTRYFTRCLFPGFEAEFAGEIKPVLQSLGVRAMFDGRVCDFTPFTDDECYCAGVTHAAKLKADKKGIEGAAATVISGAMSAGPGEETEIYEDFLVDGAFGFVLTDPCDVILFCGVVERI